MKKLFTLTALLALFATKASFAQVSFPLDIDASPLTLGDNESWYNYYGATTGYLVPSFFYGTTSYGTGWTVEATILPLPSGITVDEAGVSLNINGIDPNDTQDIPTNNTIIDGKIDINLGEFDWSLYSDVGFEWIAYYSDGSYDDYFQEWN